MKSARRGVVKAIVLTLGLVAANQASAADAVFTLPAGVACPDFDLTIEITFADTRVMKEFVDMDGNPVRLFEGGKGSELLFVNEATGATYFIMGDGSVSHTTLHPDGSQDVSSEGHNVIVFFPSDLPAGVGPSTKQYIGRVLYTVDADGVFTLEGVRGRTVDICAALSE